MTFRLARVKETKLPNRCSVPTSYTVSADGFERPKTVIDGEFALHLEKLKYRLSCGKTSATFAFVRGKRAMKSRRVAHVE
jgi:hypothetical protein